MKFFTDLGTALGTEIVEIAPQHVLCILFFILLHFAHRTAIRHIRKNAEKFMEELRLAYAGLNSQKSKGKK